MRKLLMIALLACFSVVSFGQLHIDEFYEVQREYLIFSDTAAFDSIPQAEIHKSIKNWAGVTFRDASSVIVSETESQLVLNYLSSGFTYQVLGSQDHWDWYIRMVIKIKDNKIKVMMYDDGNSYRPGTAAGTTYIPAVQARTYKFTQYFRTKKDGYSVKRYTEGLINAKDDCKRIYKSLVAEIKTKKPAKTETSTEDNW